MSSNVNNETPIDFSLKIPSLKELSLIRIARCIWNSEDVIPRVKASHRVWSDDWRDINDFAIDLIASLLLLPTLKEELIRVVNYVGNALKHWLDPFEQEHYWFADEHSLQTWISNLDTSIPDIDEREKLRRLERKDTLRWYEFETWPEWIFHDYIVEDRILWTAYGTVDSRRMALMVLRDDTIPIRDRFVLTCNLCLEDEVQRLWEWGEVKDGNYRKDDFLVHYWVRRMGRRDYDPLEHESMKFLHPMKTIPESIDEFFIEELRNSPAVDFQYRWFWPRLKDEAKQRQLEVYKRKDIHVDSNYSCFLLNQLDLERQKEFLFSSASAPESCLYLFLQRPMQHLFFVAWEIAKRENGLDLFAQSVPNHWEQCNDEMQLRLYDELRRRKLNLNWRLG